MKNQIKNQVEGENSPDTIVGYLAFKSYNLDVGQILNHDETKVLIQ